MTRTTAVIVFLVFQAAMAVLWFWSLAPLMSASGDDSGFYSSTAQVWSRSGDAGDAAAPYRPMGDMFLGTMLIMLSGFAVAFAAVFAFRSGKGGLTAGLLALALGLAGAGAWMIARQWSGATLFPAGSVNTGWLYTITRVWLLQFYIAFAFMVAFIGLTIAELATRERPRGFHLVALNWLFVVVMWIGSYLVLYVAPSLGQGG
jgi:heme/copper-type cytochrome/quinol oxidase subunit 3